MNQVLPISRFVVLTTAMCVISPAMHILAQTPMPAQIPGMITSRNGDKSSFRCEAVLEVWPRIVDQGGTFTVLCEARGGGDPAHLYNPYLSERYRLPAQVVVVSADGKIRHELFSRSREVPEKSSPSAWTLVRRTQTIGREITVRVAHRGAGASEASGTRELSLPPGEYYIQAIYNYWLVATWLNSPSSAAPRVADATGDEPRPWNGKHSVRMDEPMAVSEPVKFVVTANRAQAFAEGQPEYTVRPELHSSPIRGPLLGLDAVVRIRLTNKSDRAIEVFDPFLNPWLSSQKAVELAIIAADGSKIGNYLDVESAHGRTNRNDDWARFPPGGTVSSVYRFRPGRIPRTAIGSGDELRPGKYFLELRLHEAVIASPPPILEMTNNPETVAADAGYRLWRQTFPGPELCRSNRVELEILPRTGD